MLSDVSHFWYLNMSSFVKWGRDKSQPFPVPLGIKQGGINSPEFFAVYFDKITEILRQKGIGCHIHKLFLAIILFADDICLLAPTRSSLEKMIGLVSDYCSEYGLEFNPKKSKILVFSKSYVDLSSLSPVYMAGRPIEYTRSIKYLGTTILSDSELVFSCVE